jgi:hypothetical protein
MFPGGYIGLPLNRSSKPSVINYNKILVINRFYL